VNGAFKNPLRVSIRITWLMGELTWIAMNFVPRVFLRSGETLLEARARWLQWACRRVIRIFNLNIRATGPIPRKGLLVSNHLSYLDILLLSALTPCVFVAKREVKSWPLFGWFAILAGTVFVDRERRIQAGASAKALEAVLAHGALVVLFPEGTSSDGKNVLPFKSALLQPVASSRHHVSASAIDYHLEDGAVGEEVCYWKDMTLLPHLLNVLSKQRIGAAVRFSEIIESTADRKQLARHLNLKIWTLKQVHTSTRSEHPLCSFGVPHKDPEIVK
jgi:1-acyl-sn-glycerol-3-phosphate acyltransferase